jgi:hypothetical protein
MMHGMRLTGSDRHDNTTEWLAANMVKGIRFPKIAKISIFSIGYETCWMRVPDFTIL